MSSLIKRNMLSALLRRLYPSITEEGRFFTDFINNDKINMDIFYVFNIITMSPKNSDYFKVYVCTKEELDKLIENESEKRIIEQYAIQLIKINYDIPFSFLEKYLFICFSNITDCEKKVMQFLTSKYLMILAKKKYFRTTDFTKKLLAFFENDIGIECFFTYDSITDAIEKNVKNSESQDICFFDLVYVFNLFDFSSSNGRQKIKTITLMTKHLKKHRSLINLFPALFKERNNEVKNYFQNNFSNNGKPSLKTKSKEELIVLFLFIEYSCYDYPESAIKEFIFEGLTNNEVDIENKIICIEFLHLVKKLNYNEFLILVCLGISPKILLKFFELDVSDFKISSFCIIRCTDSINHIIKKIINENKNVVADYPFLKDFNLKDFNLEDFNIEKKKIEETFDIDTKFAESRKIEYLEYISSKNIYFSGTMYGSTEDNIAEKYIKKSSAKIIEKFEEKYIDKIKHFIQKEQNILENKNKNKELTLIEQLILDTKYILSEINVVDSSKPLKLSSFLN